MGFNSGFKGLITVYQLQRLRIVESAICCERYIKKMLAETGRDILKNILFITLRMD